MPINGQPASEKWSMHIRGNIMLHLRPSIMSCHSCMQLHQLSASDKDLPRMLKVAKRRTWIICCCCLMS